VTTSSIEKKIEERMTHGTCQSFSRRMGLGCLFYIVLLESEVKVRSKKMDGYLNY